MGDEAIEGHHGDLTLIDYHRVCDRLRSVETLCAVFLAGTHSPRGIGAAIAKRLAADGASVAITSGAAADGCLLPRTKAHDTSSCPVGGI